MAEEAVSATRTDTPIRDVPQSIQVITRKVIEEQRSFRPPKYTGKHFRHQRHGIRRVALRFIDHSVHGYGSQLLPQRSWIRSRNLPRRTPTTFADWKS
ncbi:MAG: hypothetical protein MRJ92_09025 [Nitrospira sp.]|nr:hypothetical protein [Nitrospira sp.]